MGFSVAAICEFKNDEYRDYFFGAFNRLSCKEQDASDPDWTGKYFSEFAANVETICAFYYGYDDFYEFSEMEKLENSTLFINIYGISPCGYNEYFGKIVNDFGAIKYFAVTNDDSAGYTEINILKTGEITTLIELDDCNVDKDRIFQLFEYYEQGKNLNEILLNELDLDDVIAAEESHGSIEELETLLKTTKHKDVKTSIIEKLSDIGTENAALILVDVLLDEEVQRQAFEALSRIHLPQIVTPLLEIIRTNDNKWIRYYALRCLENYPQDDVESELWALFDGDNSLDISEYIIDTLVKISGNRLSDKFIEKLQLPGLPESTIQSICEGLEQYPAVDADYVIKGIAENLDYEPGTRRSALRALASSNGKNNFEYILRFVDEDGFFADTCEALLRTGDERAIPHVIKLLKVEPDIRRLFRLFAKYGEPMIPQLVDSFSPEPEFLSVNILSALNNIGTTAAYRAIRALYPEFKELGRLHEIANVVTRAENDECFFMLLELLHEETFLDCHLFTIALKKYSEQAVNPLLDFIQDRNHTNYFCALTILGQLGDKRVLPIILNYWESADTKERGRLVEACETSADESVFGLLVECLDSPYYSDSAVRSLKNIGSDKVLDVLHDKLIKAPDNNTILVLSNIADPRSVPFLSNVLGDPTIDTNIRYAAVYALRHFKKEDVYDIVAKIAKKEKSTLVKKEAKTVLRELETKEILSRF